MAVPGRLAVIMGVEIDEAGRDDLAFGVDLLLAAARGLGLDGGDPIAGDQYVGLIGLAATAIDDGAVAYDQVDISHRRLP